LKFDTLKKCRLCDDEILMPLLELGVAKFTGVFPKPNEEIGEGRLDLCVCVSCGLVQLAAQDDVKNYFGEGYGYASSLNNDMVQYLNTIHGRAHNFCSERGLKISSVCDIGSNDATFLKFFDNSLFRVGVDPSGVKFVDEYKTSKIELLCDFFPRGLLQSKYAGKKFDLISAIAMFYDLDEPIKFLQTVVNTLSETGIFLIDVGFVPKMLQNLALDSVCHEHLAYYSLDQIVHAFDRVGLVIADSWLSDMNGGTITLICQKGSSQQHVLSKEVKEIQEWYRHDPVKRWRQAYEDMSKRCKEIKNIISTCAIKGQRVAGLGASTKGNMLLQLFDFGQEYFEGIGEVNTEKYGLVTPGSNIPICSEEELIESGVDVFFVLPWHFKEFFCRSKKFEKTSLLFMLPEIYERKRKK